MESATLTEQKAITQFEPLNYKVYLIFEAPFYKIRVGDFRTMHEAESLRDLAKEYGYNESFPVKSKVRIPLHPDGDM